MDMYEEGSQIKKKFCPNKTKRRLSARIALNMTL